MDNKLEIFTALLALALITFVLAYPTMLLWNTCLVPAVDSIRQIGFLQSLGLNILFSILFKSNQLNQK